MLGGVPKSSDPQNAAPQTELIPCVLALSERLEDAIGLSVSVGFEVFLVDVEENLNSLGRNNTEKVVCVLLEEKRPSVALPGLVEESTDFKPCNQHLKNVSTRVYCYLSMRWKRVAYSGSSLRSVLTPLEPDIQKPFVQQRLSYADLVFNRFVRQIHNADPVWRQRGQ